MSMSKNSMVPLWMTINIIDDNLIKISGNL